MPCCRSPRSGSAISPPSPAAYAKSWSTDLDNTLWGGVIGEDGISGIKIDREHPGIAYWNVQRALLDVKRRGVLLAISSKNNREDALQAFRDHPGMLLKHEILPPSGSTGATNRPASARSRPSSTWGSTASHSSMTTPPSASVSAAKLPEVTVIDLPADPMGFAEAIRRSAVLERLSALRRGPERSRYYAEQRVRVPRARQRFECRGVLPVAAQEVEIAPVSSATLARAAQLTQKTNQFNVTTGATPSSASPRSRKPPDGRSTQSA